MKNLWKYSGIYLWVTGVIHTMFGLAFGSEGYMPILRDGLVNAVGEDVGRNFSFWFLVCGVVIIYAGLLMQRYIKDTQRPAPMSLGIFLLVFSIIGCAMAPGTGFWLFIPQAIIIIVANYRLKR
jgi:MFS family permease